MKITERKFACHCNQKFNNQKARYRHQKDSKNTNEVCKQPNQPGQPIKDPISDLIKKERQNLRKKRERKRMYKDKQGAKLFNHPSNLKKYTRHCFNVDKMLNQYEELRNLKEEDEFVLYVKKPDIKKYYLEELFDNLVMAKEII